MTRYILAILLFVHIALLFMMFGAGLLDVLIFFPNWFHNIPDSLAVTKQFLSYRNPGMFFIPLTLLVMFSGVIFVVAAWKSEPARLWIVVDVVLVTAVLLLTGGFIYPRIGILVGEASAATALETLQQAASEMQVLIQVRIFMVLIAAAFGSFAMWRFHVNAPKETVYLPQPAAETE